MGEDRGEQRAHLAGVDPLLAGLLEVDAESEVVLDLDEGGRRAGSSGSRRPASGRVSNVISVTAIEPGFQRNGLAMRIR